jgi:hypothetical protein
VIFGERALRGNSAYFYCSFDEFGLTLTGKITELETVILQERQKIQRLSQELKSAE